MNKVAILICFLAFNLYGDIDWSKYNSEKDLNTLSAEQLKTIPLSEFSRIMGETQKIFSEPGMEFMTQLQLSALGYFLNNNSKIIKEKVESFQETLGVEVTGELTFGQFDILNECVSKYREPKIITDGFASISIDDDYAYAQASLILDDGNDTYLEGTDDGLPITKSIIQCERKEEICREFTVDVRVPSYGEANSTYYLYSDIEIWSIDSWSDSKIIASDISFPPSCRTTSMTINSVSNEIVQLTTNNNLEDCDFMGISTKLERPQVTKSVDPRKYQKGYWKARTDKTRDMCLNEEIFEELEKIKLGSE